MARRIRVCGEILATIHMMIRATPKLRSWPMARSKLTPPDAENTTITEIDASTTIATISGPSSRRVSASNRRLIVGRRIIFDGLDFFGIGLLAEQVIVDHRARDRCCAL